MQMPVALVGHVTVIVLRAATLTVKTIMRAILAGFRTFHAGFRAFARPLGGTGCPVAVAGLAAGMDGLVTTLALAACGTGSLMWFAGFFSVIFGIGRAFSGFRRTLYSLALGAAVLYAGLAVIFNLVFAIGFRAAFGSAFSRLGIFFVAAPRVSAPAPVRLLVITGHKLCTRLHTETVRMGLRRNSDAQGRGQGAQPQRPPEILHGHDGNPP